MNNLQSSTGMLLLVAMGAVLTARDNRAYYTAEFQDPSNPFAKTVKRNFWQQKDANDVPVWRGANPAVVKNFIGKQIPGQILSREVVPYEIPRADGTTQTVSTYTTVVLGGENVASTFKAQGHELAQQAAQIAQAAEVVENPLVGGAGDIDLI